MAIGLKTALLVIKNTYKMYTIQSEHDNAGSHKIYKSLPTTKL